MFNLPITTDAQTIAASIEAKYSTDTNIASCTINSDGYWMVDYTYVVDGAWLGTSDGDNIESLLAEFPVSLIEYINASVSSNAQLTKVVPSKGNVLSANKLADINIESIIYKYNREIYGEDMLSGHGELESELRKLSNELRLDYGQDLTTQKARKIEIERVIEGSSTTKAEDITAARLKDQSQLGWGDLIDYDSVVTKLSDINTKFPVDITLKGSTGESIGTQIHKMSDGQYYAYAHKEDVLFREYNYNLLNLIDDVVATY